MKHLGLVLCLSWVCWGCGVGGTGGEAPAKLEVEPESLVFSPDEESKTVQVKNTGGRAFQFTITVSAKSGEVEWLAAQPLAGSVSGGGAEALILTVQNRDRLAPKFYNGEVLVRAGDAGSQSVKVTMEVGQPVLHVEPSDELDYGAAVECLNLLVKNAGTGLLKYTLHLPGKWMRTDADLSKEIRSDEPQTVSLCVDRVLVPWYGEGVDEVVVTSNGKEGGGASSTARVKVRVVVESACEVDGQCEKPGSYCDNEKGRCASKKLNGQKCVVGRECQSGQCVDGICCESACEGQCRTCKDPQRLGECVPVADGSECDDGRICTEGDRCMGGECVEGAEKDCSAWDTECGTGRCSEGKGGCYTDAPEDVCVIEGVCYQDGDLHPDPFLVCLTCDPSRDRTEFSVVGGWCLIGGVCYKAGQKVGECQVCDSFKNPHGSSNEVDGNGCSADADPCTEDICKGGLCVHEKKDTGPCDDGNPCTKDDKCVGGTCKGTFYSCDDGVPCTKDTCLGDGGCVHEVVAGQCLIEGKCVGANEEKAGSHGCAKCKPWKWPEAWSLEEEGTPCEDGDPCTTGDKCMLGFCTGAAKVCDDGLLCTTDWCDPGSGVCESERLADWCVISGSCYQADMSPPGKDGQCLVCDPYKAPDQWTPRNEGKSCDDGDPCTAASVCQGGTCVAVGVPCDDGIACTEDVCKDGSCKHSVMAGKCLIDGQCHNGNAFKEGSQCLACKPLNSQVSWTPVNEGQGCDDGLYCTIGDKCQSGECIGEPRVCDAGVCQDAWCSEEKQACMTVWQDDGMPCDDNDLCTEGDQCESGRCVGVAKDCSHVGQGEQCVKGVCDPADGECKAKPVSEGEGCDDGKWCTVNDRCFSGQCQGQARDCSDQCNAGTCDEDNDQCVKTPANEGNACNDNDYCTTGEKCQSGECTGGQPTDCSNLNDACNLGVCSKAKQACVRQPKADGTDCLSSPPPPHWLSAQCQGGKCVATSCEWPYANCGVVTDCSINLQTDRNHCGDCAISCEGSCVDGQCSTAIECPPGFGDCDGDSANGCESILSSDRDNCGTCGNKCTVVHGGGGCEAGKCKVLYCDPGWADANGKYEDGCEACDPLVDGSFEIPDDGEDNDCNGGDSVNDESRGYYVDGSFVFNATCQDPGQGTRSCPFKDLLMALYISQFEQDWTNPLLVKREIYIAKGEYIDSGVVADISKPLILVGGYERIASGPWSRDIVSNKTILRSTGGIAVVAGPDIDGWAVLDGLIPTPQVNVVGNVAMRHILSSASQYPLKVVSGSSKAVLWMANCTVSGDLDAFGMGGSNWVLRNNTFEGSVKGYGERWIIINNIVQVDVAGGNLWTLTNNSIQGNVIGIGGYRWTLTNNSIQGDVSGYYEWTLTNNTIEGSVYIAGPSVGMYWTLENNIIHGGASIGSYGTLTNNTIQSFVKGESEMTLTNNTIVGNVSGGWSWTLTNNTIRVPPGTTEPAIKMGGSGWSLVNNTIIWQGNPGTHYAIREDSADADPTIVRNNAFIGFGPDTQGVYYLNEGSTPLTKILQVNMMSDLPSCGRGGNIAIDNIEDAKFLSVYPNSPLFLVPAPDSPLVNAGLGLPYTCQDITVNNPGKDIAGNPRPCGAGFDIGAYEYCGE